MIPPHEKILTPNLVGTEGNCYLYVNRRVYRFKTEGFPNKNILPLDHASSVDYLLMTLENSKYLASFNALDSDIYSDHCPLSFCFHANKGMSLRRESKPVPNSYKWDPKYRDIYRKRLTDPAAMSMRNNFLCDIVTQEITPNEVVKKFKALIEQAAYNVFKLKQNKRTCIFPVNEWFDDDCKAAKSRLWKHRDREVGTDGYKEYWKLKKSYKVLLQKKKQRYQIKLAVDVETLSFKTPQDYWQFWKDKNNTHPRQNA